MLQAFTTHVHLGSVTRRNLQAFLVIAWLRDPLARKCEQDKAIAVSKNTCPLSESRVCRCDTDVPAWKGM